MARLPDCMLLSPPDLLDQVADAGAVLVFCWGGVVVLGRGGMEVRKQGFVVKVGKGGCKRV